MVEIVLWNKTSEYARIEIDACFDTENNDDTVWIDNATTEWLDEVIWRPIASLCKSDDWRW